MVDADLLEQETGIVLVRQGEADEESTSSHVAVTMDVVGFGSCGGGGHTFALRNHVAAACYERTKQVWSAVDYKSFLRQTLGGYF